MDSGLNLVFLGAPGAGKGTQTKKLIDKYHFIHLSTGDLLRKMIQEDDPLGVKAKAYMREGQLVPDALIIDIIKSKMHQGTGYIFDGFPRTLPQAQALEKTTHIDKVVYLEVSDKELIGRLTGRRICRNCGQEYHVSFQPSKKGMNCDKCGGALYQRDDDKEEVIKKRLEVFKSQTAPLLKFYSKKLIKVDGQGIVNDIFSKIVKNLALG